MEKTFGSRAGCLMSWCAPLPLGVSKGNGNTRGVAEGLCWHPLDLTIAFKGPWDYWVHWDQPELMGLSLGGEGEPGESRPQCPRDITAVACADLGGFPALSRLCTASGRYCAACGCPAWHLPSLGMAVCRAELSPVLGSCCLLSLIPAVGWVQASEQEEE